MSSQGDVLPDPLLRRNRPVSTASLSRILTDATDSEFLPTETEGEDDDVTAVSEIRLNQLRVLEPLGYGQFGEVSGLETLHFNYYVLANWKTIIYTIFRCKYVNILILAI